MLAVATSSVLIVKKKQLDIKEKKTKLCMLYGK